MNSSDSCTCKSETLAMATTPMQTWCEPYDWETALAAGTIFPCLNLEFFLAKESVSAVCGNPTLSAEDKLLTQIYQVSFAINDLTLYLDTHPDCEHGLPLFKELLQKRLDLLAEYSKTARPLTQLSIVTGTPETTSYGWDDGPMPWEGGHN